MIKKLNAPEIWDAFGYVRVSKDDRDKDESNSIKNQRDLILDFVKKNPDIRLVDTLSDDGFTGANYDRDAFKDIIRLIESGTVNCVVVKDFSRLGRDHIETLKYIQRYFASKNVRFISINDHYDSLHADMSDSNTSLIVPFKTIINEAFLEDISIKTKTQLAIKRKNGEFVCNYAVFGYAKSSDKKLMVDDYAAEVVKAIFERKLLGYNEQQIAGLLNSKSIHSPAEYKKASGQSYNTPFAVNEKSLWTANAVKRILTNRVYIGILEQGKRTKASYRVKKFHYNPCEAWSVHENNHEPIISVQDFELVQELMKKDTRVSGETGQLQLFSGLIICAACGQPMTVKTVKKNGKSYIYYICSTHKRHGTCKNNNVSTKSIEEFVLLSIRKQVTVLLSAEEQSGGIGFDELISRKKAAIEGMIEKALRSIQDNNEYLVKSYAHMLDGVIKESEYRQFRDDFRRQIEDAEKNIAQLQIEIERLADDTKTRELVERFKTHGNITELDRRAVVGMIDSVIVRSSKDLEVVFRYESGLDAFPEYAECEAVQERAVV
jgi:DNA invertase Pin-like site-specific DNA recombinase